jgi:hypothetical protein
MAGWLTMLALVGWSWWRRLDDRRLDYRALAEAMRVRRAWALAGSARSASDSYLNQLRSELIWIRRAVQHVCPPPQFWKDQFDSLDDTRRRQRMLDVEQSWVEGQQQQHRKRKKEEHHLAIGWRTRGFLLAMAGLILLSLPLVAGHWLDASHPPNWLLSLGGMLVIVGGIFVGICERHGHEELARHYDQIFVVFRGGTRELATALRDPAGSDRARRIVEELGKEAMQENAQWLLLRRSKPLELLLGA